MKTYTYQPKGVCCQFIQVTMNDDQTINRVQFFGGCPGNAMGVAKMVEGKTIDEVISKLDGIPCGHKATSCPDQLCRALEQIKNQGE
jgi:uncharacterized protein (TIGR03905 family)